jgi:hypothetical protein
MPYDILRDDRPSHAQLRFEQRYARALRLMRENGVRYAVGPAEPLSADWPLLAQHLMGFAQQWRWIMVEHDTSGPLGRLILISQGLVSDEQGLPFTSLDLMQWATERLRETHSHVLAENESKMKRLVQQYKQAGLALPAVEVAGGGGLASLTWLTLVAPQQFGQTGYTDWVLGVTLSAGLSMAAISGWLWLAGWRYAMRKKYLPCD